MVINWSATINHIAIRPRKAYISHAGSAPLVLNDIPGAILIFQGAVPGPDRGLDHTAPTCLTGSGGLNDQHGPKWFPHEIYKG